MRLTLPSQRTAWFILCFHDEMLIVLHGFIKKTQKTPADDLALAKRRMKKVTDQMKKAKQAYWLVTEDFLKEVRRP